MHMHFERTVNTKSDCPILSLSWMGKVPEDFPEDGSWALTRSSYYHEGWLASGNVRGIVGVTFTTSHCKKTIEYPSRTNYNLRGHRSDVILVKWNEPYQKLASCDSTGIIFVWIKYEGRWSIELVNDRGHPVTDFSWSHDGRMALISYQDGFVLVGSVAGQRYWSSMLALDDTITCGLWTPDDQQVYFGTASGKIVVMDVNGAMVSQLQVTGPAGISSMAWSCEKFKLAPPDEETVSSADRKQVLAVSLQNGHICLMASYDDCVPVTVKTGLQGPVCMEWSNSKGLLAVAGIVVKSPSSTVVQLQYTNMLQFYNERGVLVFQTQVPDVHARVTTLTWGHNDERLFVATGSQIHIAWVADQILPLHLLARVRIFDILPSENLVARLPLPVKLRNAIGSLFVQTIRCSVPEPTGIREFVSRPPAGAVRLHCTMIRHDEDNSSGTCYTLYLEYLGGLVPLLKGKKISKIRPEFVIFDPQIEDLHLPDVSSSDSKRSSSSSNSTPDASGGLSDSSDSEKDEICTASPRLQGRRRKKYKKTSLSEKIDRAIYGYRTEIELEPDLSYVDTLPEQVRLVEVTSNIWGTKFKFHGTAPVVPANLGQVTYKTSLLHLQPRQMTLVVTELRDDVPIGPDPTFNPNVFSEDEEEPPPHNVSKGSRMAMEHCPPIAPMSPRTSALNKQKSYVNGQAMTGRLSEEIADDRANLRPQNLLRPTSNSQNSTSFIGPLSKSSGQNQKHAISPICCEVAVPALQSPKNAVAPSDIIFDRPSAPAVISYPSTTSGNLQVKSNIDHLSSKNDTSGADQPRLMAFRRPPEATSSDRPVVKSKEEAKTTEEPFKTKPAFPSATLIPRSCSVGYLDMVDAQMVPPGFRTYGGATCGDNLSKRLILVDTPKDLNRRRPSRLRHRPTKAGDQLKSFSKSKSLDSSDIFHSSSGHNVSFVVKETQIPEQVEPAEVQEVIVPVKDETFINSNNNHNNNIGGGKLSSPTGHYDNSASDSSNDKTSNNNNNNNNNNKKTARDFFSSPLMRRKKDRGDKGEGKMRATKAGDSSSEKNGVPMRTQALLNLEKLITKLREDDSTRRNSPPASKKWPKSSPSSPAPSKKGQRPQSASPIRRKLLNSPFLRRRYKNLESSDDDVNGSGDETCNGANYKDLETFQKSQLRQKVSGGATDAKKNTKIDFVQLKRGKIEPNGGSYCSSSTNNNSAVQKREFVMHNKTPMWNENSQVYQLDFGGRVTQESAKNFQIEFRGKQVMQFGRIDSNAYTLDFQYPFSPLQAFAVALANVTQRLK